MFRLTGAFLERMLQNNQLTEVPDSLRLGAGIKGLCVLLTHMVPGGLPRRLAS